jgi:hypothetical protein
LSIARLFTVVKIRPKVLPWVVRPVFCVIISTFLTKVFIGRFGRFSTETIEVAAHVILAASLYLLLTVILRKAKKKDL